MSINYFNINERNISLVTKEQTFWIGENADVKVVVTLNEHGDERKMTAWLYGTEEISTIEYNGSNNYCEIIEAMESLVSDNEEYILELSSWMVAMEKECFYEDNGNE